MGDKTGIGWTDASWNPCTGCRKISPGCKHCYAEAVADRFWPTQYPPIWVGSNAVDDTVHRPRRFTDVQCHPERLDQPLRWTRPRLIFVNSMSDLWHEDVPTDFIDEIFAVMALCDGTRSSGRRHQFQILTKRAERMQAYLTDPDTKFRVNAAIVNRVITGYRPIRDGCDWSPCKPWPSPNVRVGVSVENRETASPRLAHVIHVFRAGWKTMVSFEPLLGPIDVGIDWDTIGWAIFGGESGQRPEASLRYREMPMDGDGGAKRLVLDARSHGVPVFVKQDSGLRPGGQGRWPDELWQLKEMPDV